MLIGPIPSSFIVEKTLLSLPELWWAFDSGVIGAQNVVDVAKSMVRESDGSNVVARLTTITRAELSDVNEILSVVHVDDEDVDAIRRKWVWLALSWLYENHRDDSDVLDKIDGLYADFGYPPEMSNFGPYAPAYQVKGDPASQREQVVAELRQYLSRGEESFGLRTPR